MNFSNLINSFWRMENLSKWISFCNFLMLVNILQGIKSLHIFFYEFNDFICLYTFNLIICQYSFQLGAFLFDCLRFIVLNIVDKTMFYEKWMQESIKHSVDQPFGVCVTMLPKTFQNEDSHLTVLPFAIVMSGSFCPYAFIMAMQVNLDFEG